MSMSHSPHVANGPDIPLTGTCGAVAARHGVERARIREAGVAHPPMAAPSSDTEAVNHAQYAARETGLTARRPVDPTSPRNAYPSVSATRPYVQAVRCG